MAENNLLYNQAVYDRIKLITGYEADEDWQQCFRTNSTYLDCPIAEFFDVSEYEFSVAVHNPSTSWTNEVRITVPHGRDSRYSVEAYTQHDNFTAVNSSTSCYKETLEKQPNKTQVSIDNCYLYIEHKTPPHGLHLFKISYATDGDAQENYEPLKEGDSLESQDLKVLYVGSDKNSSQISFAIQDNLSSRVENLTFGLKYWRSCIPVN